ncbi:hypothetical protein B738_29031 [Photorhabdus temperata subsp. temperata M1021]|nr:hypothetical protein B738_29031 [Photorhabdus temperata subsp. temperata M1021]
MRADRDTGSSAGVLLLTVIAVAVLFATERQVAFYFGGNLFAADLRPFERDVPATVQGDSLPRL